MSRDSAVHFLSMLHDRRCLVTVYSDTEKGFLDNYDYIYCFADEMPEEGRSGVMTEFTRCYAPGCGKGSVCYSPTCARASWRVRERKVGIG